MKLHPRRLAVGVAAGALGLASLAGCAAGGRANTGGNAAPADTTDTVSSALSEIGVDPAGLVLAAPTSTPSAQPGHRGRPIRRFLRRNTLHGEITVQTKNGVRTIVVQRGKVTAASATGLTVQSTDGYTVTWTYGSPLRVVANRTQADKSAVKVGEEVGVAGLKNGTADDARWVVLPVQ